LLLRCLLQNARLPPVEEQEFLTRGKSRSTSRFGPKQNARRSAARAGLRAYSHPAHSLGQEGDGVAGTFPDKPGHSCQSTHARRRKGLTVVFFSNLTCYKFCRGERGPARHNPSADHHPKSMTTAGRCCGRAAHVRSTRPGFSISAGHLSPRTVFVAYVSVGTPRRTRARRMAAKNSRRHLRGETGPSARAGTLDFWLILRDHPRGLKDLHGPVPG